MNDERKSSIYVFLAGAFWGIISLFAKRITANALQLTAVRMLIAATVIFFIIIIKDPKLLKIRFRDLPVFLGTGIFSIVFFNTCYFYTMKNGEASVAVVLLYTSPVFVMLLSAVLFREKITRKKIAALIVTMAGVVLVSGIISGSTKISGPILLAGIGSGFFYASYSIFGRIALRKYSSLTVTFYTFLVGLIASAPICGPVETVKSIAADPLQIVWHLGVGVVCTVLPYIFYTKGLEKLETGKAAIIVTVEPLVGCLIGIFVYNESAGFLKILGILLIFAAVIFLNVDFGKKSKT